VTRPILALIALFSLAGQVDAWAGDAARGRVVASVRCTPCHHLDMTNVLIGPGLLGVYGRKPTISGVPFALWDEKSLDIWLRNPRAVKPNTKMSIPPISDKDRADLIAYLRSQSTRD